MNQQLTLSRRKFFSLVFLSFAMMSAAQAQVINSISPASGPVGSSITITGTGFSAVTTQNIVRVGGIRATVTAASANSLTVLVPAGARPVNTSITVGGLTAYSRNPFVVTFEGDTTGFKRSHFDISPEIFAHHMNTADINNDGKSDLILLNNARGVSIALNTSTPGQVSFGNEQRFETDKIFRNSTTGDLDGDGKLDLVLLDSLNNSFYIFRNISSGATVSFAPSVNYVVDPQSKPGNIISVADLDMDGKPEVITSSAVAYQLSIYKNNSSTGDISLLPAFVLDMPGFPESVRIADMDGDGKPDLVPHTRTYYYQFPVFLNSSMPGTFSFATSGNPIYTDLADLSLTVGDLNQDQLPDAIITNEDRYYIHRWRNTSTVGNFSVTPQNTVDADEGSVCSSFGDLDGDGKPDVVVSNYRKGILLFKNRTEAGGNLVFADSMNINFFNQDTTILCDVDVDGVLDIILRRFGRVNILRNTMGICTPTPARVDLQTSADSVCGGSDVTLTAIPQNGGTNPTYQWKINGNDVPNNNSNQLTTGALTADAEIMVIMTSNSTCVSSVVDTMVRIIEVYPAAAASVTVAPSSNKVCPGTTVTFTATPVNGGAAPVYQWKKNGVTVGTNNPVYTDNTLVTGDSVMVTMISNAVCASPQSVTSAAVRVTIDPGTSPVVTISGNTNIEPGNASLISTGIINPGSGTTYQWQDSTASHVWQNITGATSSTLSYEPIFTGDKVRCMISGTVCSSLQTVTSNALSFNVLTGGRLTPNPVGVYLTIRDLNPSDQWQRLDIVNLATGLTEISVNIQNDTSVLLFVGQLSPGIYAAVLKRSSGPWHYLRFVKK